MATPARPDRRPVPPGAAASLALPPGTRSAADAVRSNDVLTSLAARIRASQDRLQSVLPLLPPAMRAHVRPGPIDDQGWSLLVDSPAVSAKLRQMLPALSAQLRQAGWPDLPLRVKLLGRG